MQELSRELIQGFSAAHHYYLSRDYLIDETKRTNTNSWHRYYYPIGTACLKIASTAAVIAATIVYPGIGIGIIAGSGVGIAALTVREDPFIAGWTVAKVLYEPLLCFKRLVYLGYNWQNEREPVHLDRLPYQDALALLELPVDEAISPYTTISAAQTKLKGTKGEERNAISAARRILLLALARS